MAKTIFKEIIITLLLCIVILLILSVLFYNYNPINKIIPSKVAYSTPNNVKEEIEVEVENVLSIENRVYVVEGADLNVYRKDSTYSPGRENPFSTIVVENTTISTGGNINTGTTNNSDNINNKDNAVNTIVSNTASGK